MRNIFQNRINVKKAPMIGRYKKRMAINAETSLNPKRFDNIDRTPNCLSMIKNTACLNFRKHKGRDINETLLPVRPYQTDYDKHTHGKDYLGKKLNTGSVDMQKHKQIDARGTRNSISHITVVQGANNPQSDYTSVDHNLV